MINSRSKGKRGELELCKELNKELPGINARRGQQFKGSPDSPDIAHDYAGVHIECKWVEKLNIHNAMEQAVRDAGSDTPSVMHKRNEKEWLVTIRLRDLVAFVDCMYYSMNIRK